MSPPQAHAGFTLIEVLVALVIASVALLACMRALALGADSAGAMHERSLALLAAENRLAEMRLLHAFPPAGRSSEHCPQGPFAFTCEQEFRNTVNGNLRQVTVRVRLPQGPVLAELTGLLTPMP